MKFKLVDVNRLRKFKELLLNNTLTSESINQALTAAQGKVLNDKIDKINKLISNYCPFPLEAVYTQYPKQKSPLELWPETQWVELLEYNGAFFRSENAPKTLYSVDGTTFYKDIEKKFPVEIAGLGNITYTGTQYNSKGELMKIYTGSWTSGNAAEYINETDVLIAQNQATAKNGLSLSNTLSVGNSKSGGSENVTTGMSGDYHASANGWRWGQVPTTSGRFSKTDYNAGKLDGWEGASGSHGGGLSLNLSHTHNVYLRGSVSLGNGDSETRPLNYTMRIWKRIA